MIWPGALRNFKRAALAVLLCVSTSSLRAGYSADIRPDAVLSTNFQGWGTSLCWWANVVGGYSNRADYAHLAFKQLKLNIVRYNIGGGENPALADTIYSYRAIMEGFEPSNGVWNWNVDANQRWMLRRAVASGANLVVAFANSPPWWMTVSGSVTGAPGGTNNLQVAAEPAFAAYLATVVSNLSLLDGVHFDFVTPMNEPTGAWKYANHKQEGCHMSPEQQARLVADLAPELRRRAPGSTIDAPEDFSEKNSVTDLGRYPGDALDSIALLTTHTYRANSPRRLRHWAASLHRPLWVSEYGDKDATGLTMAQRIHDDLTALRARAWVYWQVVDSASGWGFLYNPLSPDGDGFTTNYVINEKFYVMGQFSEFIRPGFNILKVNDPRTLAAWNPTNSTLVLVTVNTNATDFNVTYKLRGFPALAPQAAVYRTSPTENLAALPTLPLDRGRLTSLIPARSVTTFVLHRSE